MFGMKKRVEKLEGEYREVIALLDLEESHNLRVKKVIDLKIRHLTGAVKDHEGFKDETKERMDLLEKAIRDNEEVQHKATNAGFDQVDRQIEGIKKVHNDTVKMFNDTRLEDRKQIESLKRTVELLMESLNVKVETFPQRTEIVGIDD